MRAKGLLLAAALLRARPAGDAFLLLLAFPPLEAASVYADHGSGGGHLFFLPTVWVVSGEPLRSQAEEPAALAAPLLVPRPPGVYVLILPAMGIGRRGDRNNTRKPLWGTASRLLGVSLGFMSFVVWAHTCS